MDDPPMKCPVCGSQNPDSSETCSVCGYDLTPYPSVLGEIPEAFLEKERRRVAAAKRVWEQAQARVAAAEAKQVELEDRLGEVSRNIEALTSSEVNWFEILNLGKLYKQLPSGFRLAKKGYLASKSNVQKIMNIKKSSNRSKLDFPSNRSNISYYKLEDSLFSGNWGKADIETANLMWKIMNREQEKWLSNQDIINFPCRDLMIIDKLWDYHSQSKFGFTVQREMWERYGSPQELNEAWLLFCEKLGWKKSNQWFNLLDLYHEESPSPGLFPCCVFSGLGFGGMVWLATGTNLFSRLTACQNLHNQNLDSPRLGEFQ
jgi:hypothetical protein